MCVFDLFMSLAYLLSSLFDYDCEESFLKNCPCRDGGSGPRSQVSGLSSRVDDTEAS